MRQIFQIGVLMSALLILVAGCGSLPWAKGSSGSKETRSEQPGEERVGAKTDEAGGPASQAGIQSTSVPASGAVRQVGAVDVLFAFDRWELSKAVQTELLLLVKKLRENPRLTVDLEGYADSVGARDYNLQLSQKRVEAVRGYLVEKGVEASRIRSGGLGQLADGGTPEERAKNRRVTLKLMVASD